MAEIHVDFTCGNCGAKNRLARDKVLHLTKSPLCGKCDTPLLRAYDKFFDDLDPESYLHPLDKEALEALKRIPGISTLLRSLIRHSFELATRLHHHANFVRVSSEQLPSLWAKFEYAGRSLGIKQLPELYVYQDPVPNAYTFGVDKFFVAVSTGCLELLDDDEITCVLAHELGHVHADHVLYKSAARVFGSMASTIIQATFGVGTLVVYPVQLALLRWDRASELSSDRAALLVMKNPQIVMRTLMKVAGGTRRYAGELSIDAFIEQADGFGKMQDEGPLGRYIAIFQSLFRSHPYPIWRTKEILDWVQGGNYLEILDGDYQVRTLAKTKPCTKCGHATPLDLVVCPACGNSFGDGPEPDDSELDENGDPISRAWGDIRDWYKKTFTTDSDPEIIDAESEDLSDAENGTGRAPSDETSEQKDERPDA